MCDVSINLQLWPALPPPGSMHARKTTARRGQPDEQKNVPMTFTTEVVGVYRFRPRVVLLYMRRTCHTRRNADVGTWASNLMLISGFFFIDRVNRISFADITEILFQTAKDIEEG